MNLGLTQRQRWKYFGLCRKAITIRMHGRCTWTKKEEEDCRHEITREALGVHKSSTQFTNLDFDRVLAKLYEIVEPDSASEQLRLLGQERRRALYRVRMLISDLRSQHAVSGSVSDDAFIRGVIEQIEDGIDPNSEDAAWQRERERSWPRHSLDDLTVVELKRVMDALRAILRRGRRKVDKIYHLNAA